MSIRTAASGRAEALVLPAGIDHVSGEEEAKRRARAEAAEGRTEERGGKFFCVRIIQTVVQARARGNGRGVSPGWRKGMTKHLHNLCMPHHGVGD